MKILLSHNYYQHPGGESQVFENQVTGLRQMGEQVITYTRHNNDILNSPMRDYTALVLSAFDSRKTRQDLLTLIETEKPDVAIVQNVFPLISPSIYRALSDAGIPIIQAIYNYRFICPSAELYTEGAICERCVPGNTAHAVVHRCYRQSYTQSAWYASILGFHRLIRTFSQKINSFMVPDNFLGSKLVQGGIPARKIWRNPNPFFVGRDRPITSHGGYVLFVGRLVPQKGILTLLRAMSRTDEFCRLVVVGQGELEQDVKEKIVGSGLVGRVKFMGPLWGNELNNILEKCAAVVIPSEWYDNLPLILCQANAIGKPVIASRINGIPEYIVEGQNGFLFEVGDAIGLAHLIEQMLSFTPDEYATLSNMARAFAEDVLDYPNHYQRLMKMIGKIIVSDQY